MPGVLHSRRSISRQPRLWLAFVLPVVLILVGAVGYTLIEDWQFWQGVYMTVITVSTVGFGEVWPLSFGGRMFTIFLVLVSLGIFGYSVSVGASFLLEGEFRRIIEERRMDKRINQMSDHIIVCGAGRTGRSVMEELDRTGVPYVLIEHNEDRIEHLRSLGLDVPHIHGDATEDEILTLANIGSARGMVTVLSSDKDNVFVVLSARGLNPKLRIIARLDEENNLAKLRKAGADEVVSPNTIGGMRMATLIQHKHAVGFIEALRQPGEHGQQVFELNVGPKVVGKTIGGLNIKERSGVLVLSIHHANGDYQLNPPTDTALTEGDLLIVLGDPEQIESARILLN